MLNDNILMANFKLFLTAALWSYAAGARPLLCTSIQQPMAINSI